MALTLVKPKGTVIPKPGNVTLLAGPVGVTFKAKGIVFKVKEWDATKHPKGAKGLFVETANKTTAGKTAHGDVLVAKSGKVFKVEKQTPKGVKVNPVDLHSGEVKPGYTVLGNDVQVGVVEVAKSVGSQHPVGDLPEGTFIQTKAGKRFKITKHGKWTTVYPVNDNGEVTGKHTVLPPGTVVTIDAPKTGLPMTEPVVEKIANIAEQLGLQGAPGLKTPEVLPGSLAFHTLKPGDKVVQAGDPEVMEVANKIQVSPGDKPYVQVTDGNGYYFKLTSTLWDSQGWSKIGAGTGTTLTQEEADAQVIAKLADYLVLHGNTDYGNVYVDIAGATASWENVTDMKGSDFAHAYAPMWDSHLKEELAWTFEDYVKDAKAAMASGGGPSMDEKKAILAKALASPVADVMGGDPAHEGDVAAAEQQIKDMLTMQSSLPASVVQFVDWMDASGGVYNPFEPTKTQYAHLVWNWDAAWQTIGHVQAPAESEIGPGAIVHWYAPGAEGGGAIVGQVVGPANVPTTGVYTHWEVLVTKGDGLWAQTGETLTPDEKVLTLGAPKVTTQMPLDMKKAALAEAVGPMVAEFLMDADVTDPEDMAMGTTALHDMLAGGIPGNLESFKHALNEVPGLELSAPDDVWAAVWDEWNKTLKEVEKPVEVPAAKQVQEILPTKLPKIPKKYMEGVGQNTKVIMTRYPNASDYTIRRVQEGSDNWGQVIGTASSKGAARKLARSLAADHEEIVDEERQLYPSNAAMAKVDYEVGGLVIASGGAIWRVEAVEPFQEPAYKYDPNSPLVAKVRLSLSALKKGADGGLEPVDAPYPHPWITQATPGFFVPIDAAQASLAEPQAGFDTVQLDKAAWQGQVFEHVGMPMVHETVLRKARPERYSPYLQADWNPEMLVGRTVNESLAALRPLGYREIKPRQKDMVRMINAQGRRLYLHREGQFITSVRAPTVDLVDVPHSRDYYDQVMATMESGGDLSLLDPAKDIPMARTSHVRNLIYDMAVGKTNKVEEKIGKHDAGATVKTDEEYMDDIIGHDVAGQYTLQSYRGKVDRPDYVVGNPRLSCLKMFGLDVGVHADSYTTDQELTTEEATALAMIMKRRVMGALVAQPTTATEEGSGLGEWKEDFVPALKSDDPVEGARKLAAAVVEYKYMKTGPLTDMREGTRDYLLVQSDKWAIAAQDKLATRDGLWDNRAKALRTADLKDEIAQRRKVDGTVAVAPGQADFDLPVLSEVAFQPQTWSDIQQLVSEIDTLGSIGSQKKSTVPQAHEVWHDGNLSSQYKVVRVAGEDELSAVGGGMVTGQKIPEGHVQVVQMHTSLGQTEVSTLEMPQAFSTIPIDLLVEHVVPVVDSSPIPTDVPAFYAGGYVKDGVLHHRTDRTDGKVDQEFDGVAVAALQNLGAQMVENSKSINPGYNGTAKMHDGQMWLLEDNAIPVTPMTDEQQMAALPAAMEQAFAEIHGQSPDVAHVFAKSIIDAKPDATTVDDVLDDHYWTDEPVKARTRALIQQIGVKAPTGLDPEKVRGTLVTHYMDFGKIGLDVADELADATIQGAAVGGTPNAKDYAVEALHQWYERFGSTLGSSDYLTKQIAALQEQSRRIEYVPHDQAAWDAGGAPTNQRGRLTMEGYTPQEAAERLRELGLLGDLEPEVPFQSVLRSPRRYGHLAPLHPAYVRGEAPLPKTPARITHGITGDASIGRLKQILKSGGLLSIHERHRQGIKAITTSPSGDIRSGIDHAVFCTLGTGGACGSGSSIKIVMKPSAFLRRDIVLSPNDFGAADSRYPQYRNYLNGLQQKTYISKTNLYVPIDPAVRQEHLNTVDINAGSEYNLGPSVPIEDMEAIGVPAESIAEVDALLDDMLAHGQIAVKPRVVRVVASSFDSDVGVNQLALQKTDGT